MANAQLTPEVTSILKRAAITDNLLVLSPADAGMDRKLYEQVAKAIKLAGGAWKTNRKGFVFDSDPRAKLGLALETGVVVDTKKLRQAFYTTEWLAEEIALMADVVGQRVLEPSAGSGALLRACLKFGAAKVDCIELEITCRPQLEEAGAQSVRVGDFLSIEPDRTYQRIVMNPPFTRGQDAKHVRRAKEWLAPHGRIFAVVPDADKPWMTEVGAETVKRFEAGAFKESGTKVATRLIRVLL